MSQYSDWLQAG